MSEEKKEEGSRTPSPIISPSQRPARRKGKISKDDIMKSAAIMGDSNMFVKLLKEKAFTTYQDEEGNSPLHHCSEHGHITLVKLLIEKNANPNINNKSLSTPLHIASVNGHQDVVSYLLKSNVSVNFADIGGLTALHWAVTARKKNIAKLLLKANAEANAVDSKGTTPVHLAAGLSKDPLMALLLKYNGSIHMKTFDGQTPLHIACANNRVSIANLLVDNGADVNAKNEIGDTPMHIAVQRGSLAIVQRLMEEKADMDMKNVKGQIPVDMATEESVKMLLRGRTVFLEDEWCMVEADNSRLNSVTVLDAHGDDEKRSIVEQLGQRRKESYIYILDGAEGSFEVGLKKGKRKHSRGAAMVVDNNVVCPVLVRRNVARPMIRKLAQFLSSKVTSETNFQMEPLRCSAPPGSLSVRSQEFKRDAEPKEQPPHVEEDCTTLEEPIIVDIKSKKKSKRKRTKKDKTQLREESSATHMEPEEKISVLEATWDFSSPSVQTNNEGNEEEEEEEEEEEYIPPVHSSFTGYSTLDETKKETSDYGSPSKQSILSSSADTVENQGAEDDLPSKNLMRRSLPNNFSGLCVPDERLVGLLETLGLSKYIDTFIEEEWDWDALLEITDMDLRDLGIKSGSRRKIIAAITRAKEQNMHSQSTPICVESITNQYNRSFVQEKKDYIVDYQEINKIRYLGKGFYGEVFLGSWSGMEVAVKQMTRPMESLQKWLLEIELLHQLRHPNIVMFYCACVEPPNYCIVLEYVSRGSLEKVLSDPIIQITHERRLKILCDIARGVQYLHSRNPPIIHRDLKSDNILVDEHWVAKVSDFGLSRYKDETYSYGKASTPFDVTIAPWEVLEKNHISEKADAYSFGLMMWEMYTRVRPFKNMNPRWVAERIIHDKISPSLEDASNWDPDYVELMKTCWDHDYSLRPSFKKILQRLEQLYSTESKANVNVTSCGYIEVDL